MMPTTGSWAELSPKPDVLGLGDPDRFLEARPVAQFVGGARLLAGGARALEHHERTQPRRPI